MPIWYPRQPFGGDVEHPARTDARRPEIEHVLRKLQPGFRLIAAHAHIFFGDNRSVLLESFTVDTGAVSLHNERRIIADEPAVDLRPRRGVGRGGQPNNVVDVLPRS